MIIELKCKKHPRYREPVMPRAPASPCMACHAIWSLINGQMFMDGSEIIVNDVIVDITVGK